MKRVLATAIMATMGLASAASAAAIYNIADGKFSYAEDFQGWAVGETDDVGSAVPKLTGTAASDYWRTDGNYNYTDNWWKTAGDFRLWNYTNAGNNKASLNLADIPALSTLTVTNATVKAEIQSGRTASWWNDVYTQVWLLDAAGNGYMGKATHVGYLSLYTVTAGAVSNAALANGGYNPASDNGAQPLTIGSGDTRFLELSAINGLVTFNMIDKDGKLRATAAANNTSTTSFTNIAIQGRYEWDQQHNIDNVTLTGSVPEAASLSVLGLGAVGMLIRKRR